MRVAKITAPGRIEIFKEDVPSLNGSRVLVRLLKAAICGSDLPYFSNRFNPESYPFPSGYPGHECLGIVEESKSADFKKGDHVMYYPLFLDAYKEYHVAESSRLQLIPADGDHNILLLTQLLGAVSHAMFRIDNPYNKNVVVLGQGPVGLLFTSLLKNFGAYRIIAVDPLEYRLETALKMGADYTINPDKENVVNTVTEINSGNMADIVIDAYGQDSNVINLCFDCARHGGQVVFFGICLEEAPRLNFNVFFRKELRMIACVGPDVTVDYPYALDMILKNSIDVSPLITHIMPFEEIQRGFEMSVNREDNVIKVILEY